MSNTFKLTNLATGEVEVEINLDEAVDGITDSTVFLDTDDFEIVPLDNPGDRGSPVQLPNTYEFLATLQLLEGAANPPAQASEPYDTGDTSDFGMVDEFAFFV